MSLYGSLLHAVKYRPEISYALQPTGSALSFPTEELYECLMHVLVYLGRTRLLGTSFTVTRVTSGFTHSPIVVGALRVRSRVTLSSLVVAL